ncbi:hypothetical protein [Pseudomonas sp. AM4(2022)]|uniref:hypothetical protein n=1 Tax=Pseudomonas sp. AM4(2022) TaxID=2983408 RepID=UPI002E822E57|nr:hypothetical protein [Pseudomonas sp. AM4(2022)]
MPDCQSGAVHSVVCGTITYMAVAGDIGVCHADCHEGECRKALEKGTDLFFTEFQTQKKTSKDVFSHSIGGAGGI